MSRVNIVAITCALVLCLQTISCGERTCSPYLNEESKCVQSCPPQKTCQNREIKFSCIQSVEKCKFQCVCKPGYFRNSGGFCVTDAQCDMCDGPSEYYFCGGACDNVCDTLSTQNQTNCPIINIKCNEKCYCDASHARNKNNICVLISQCDTSQPSVCRDPNAEYIRCNQSCAPMPDLCSTVVSKYACPPKPVCKTGCFCKSGYLRKTVHSPCIPMNKCPQLAGTS